MQRGADAGSGMDPGLTNVLLLGIGGPVLFLDTGSTESSKYRFMLLTPIMPLDPFCISAAHGPCRCDVKLSMSCPQ